eukprot:762798-Hanusia_phi.AAC.1
MLIVQTLIPALEGLHASLKRKEEEFAHLVKIGRTHLQDATPLTLGQEISGYAKQVRTSVPSPLPLALLSLLLPLPSFSSTSLHFFLPSLRPLLPQIENGIARLRSSLPCLCELALGGTAVGTGLNCEEGYDQEIAEFISQETGPPPLFPLFQLPPLPSTPFPACFSPPYCLSEIFSSRPLAHLLSSIPCPLFCLALHNPVPYLHFSSSPLSSLFAWTHPIVSGLKFRSAPNKFESLAAHDAIVQTSGCLNTLVEILSASSPRLLLLPVPLPPSPSPSPLPLSTLCHHGPRPSTPPLRSPLVKRIGEEEEEEEEGRAQK